VYVQCVASCRGVWDAAVNGISRSKSRGGQ